MTIDKQLAILGDEVFQKANCISEELGLTFAEYMKKCCLENTRIANLECCLSMIKEINKFSSFTRVYKCMQVYQLQHAVYKLEDYLMGKGKK